MIGEQISEFHLEEIIGYGGMATVYRAYQPSVDRYVAVKVLPRKLSDDPTFIKRFRHEARLIARLEHRSILPVYAYGEHEGMPYIVMRLLEAGSLRRRMLSEPVDLQTTARIIRQVAEALDYAHAHGVIHRDLKPSNILLDTHDNAYLTDFGIAQIVGTELDDDAKGVVGTPYYMSPEQCRGKQASPASDIYALGTILYELITGSPPYEADTPRSVMYMQVKAPVPSAVHNRPELPTAVDHVISRAMAKRPEDRYPSAAALAADFQYVTIEAALQPSTFNRPRTGNSLIQRQGWLVGIILLAAFVLIAAGFGLTYLAGQDLQALLADENGQEAASTTSQSLASSPNPSNQTPDEDLIVEPTSLPTETPTLAPAPTLPTADSATPEISVPSDLEGQLVYTSGVNDAAEIMVREAEGTALRQLTENSVYDGEPDFSPDGAFVVFESLQTGNMDLYIMAASGDQAPRQLTRATRADRHPDFSPDGTLIIYEGGSGNDAELYVIPSEGGDPTRLTTNDYADRAPQFSPEGTRITIMTNARGRWEIALLSYPTGELLQIFECPAPNCRFPTWSPDGTNIAFNTLDEDNNTDGIYLLDVVSGQTQRVTEGGEDSRPVFSSDGSRLYFTSTQSNATSNLYYLAFDSGIVTVVADTPDEDYAPDWGPAAP